MSIWRLIRAIWNTSRSACTFCASAGPSSVPVAAGTDEGPAEAQKVQADLDVFQIALINLQMDIANRASKATIREDTQVLDEAFRQLIRDEVRFAHDSHKDLGS